MFLCIYGHMSKVHASISGVSCFRLEAVQLFIGIVLLTLTLVTREHEVSLPNEMEHTACTVNNTYRTRVRSSSSG